MKKNVIDLLIQNTLNFIIFFIPIVFWQPFLDPFGPSQLMILRVFVPFLFFLFIYKSYSERLLYIKKTPFLFPFFGYLIVSLISIYFSINKIISFKYFEELFLSILGGFLIYNLTNKHTLKKIIFIIIISHTLMSLYGLFQHFDMDIFKWNTNFSGRPMGTIGNPDFFAGEQLFVIFFLLSYILFSKKIKFFYIFLLLINLLCFFYTKVIGAYIGFISGFIITIFIFFLKEKDKIYSFLKNNKKYILIVLIILFIISGFSYSTINKKINNLYNEKKRSLIHRLLMWKVSLLMIKEKPIFGKGIGSYRLNYPYYQGIVLNSKEGKIFDYVVTWMPHQNYLLIASETGILGLGFFLLGIIVFYKICYIYLFKNKKFSYELIGILGGITSILGASFFNTFYNIASTTLLFFTLLFLSYIFIEKEKKLKIEKLNFIKVLLILSAIITIYFVFTDGNTLLANAYLKKANKLSDKGNYKEALKYYKRVINLYTVELCPQTDVAQYYYMAENFRRMGDIVNAEKFYRKDLKINPFCPEVNNMLGAACGQLNKIDDAIKYLNMAIFVAPHYKAAYKNLATAYLMKKDYKNVRRVLNAYIEKNGKDKEIEKLIKILNKIEKR